MPSAERHWPRLCTQVNQAADWWALGVLLLEMLTGESPFADKDGDELKTLSNISNGRLEMSDEHAAAEWGKMSIGLCTVKIATRLGYLKAGADVVEHPWLRGIDWDALANRTCQPPWASRRTSSHESSVLQTATVSWPVVSIVLGSRPGVW